MRARSLARTADALWGVASEQGRALFREAWEAAEKADRESEEPPNLRRDVLTRAAKRDRSLAEEFLQKLASERHEPQAEAPRSDLPSRGDLWELPEALESAPMRAPLAPAAVATQLRLAFFRTAGSVLLRPQPQPGQDRSTTGVTGRYMALKRLLPLFEQYAPQEITQVVRGQFEALNSMMSDDLRRAEDEWVHRGITPERPVAERERSLLEGIERAGSPSKRDQLYFKLALLSLGDDDVRARDYVGKIEDVPFRKQARAWVDWSAAVRAVEKRKIEAALELARGGELTPIQRVWLLTWSAKLLARAERGKAISLLDDARAEVRLIGSADSDRPRGLLAIAGALAKVEPARVWDALLDAVEAANAAEGFTGDSGVLVLTANSKGQIMTKREVAPDFDVEGIFGQAARVDSDRAIQLAGGFKGEASRTNATVAIALAVLNEKSAPTPRPATRN